MQEKIIFREMLSEIKALADRKENYITREEIKDFFRNAHLEEEQFDLLYEYLAGQKIEIEGYQPVKANGYDMKVNSLDTKADGYDTNVDDQDMKANGQDTKADGQDMKAGGWDTKAVHASESDDEDAFIAMYLKDLEEVVPVSGHEEFQLFEKAAAGDDLAKARLTEQYLHAVYELSQAYSGIQVQRSDIIQEGNIGLLLAMNHLPQQQNLEGYRNYLHEEIRNAMQGALEDQEILHDLEKEMAVRVNYLNEAVQNLERDLERKVSIEELSAYLEMPIEEIKDILRMAGDEITVDGEIHPEGHSH